MTKTLTISGTARTTIARSNWVFSECANRGQVGVGSVTLDDPGAALTIPAMKAWNVAESAASQTRVMTGWTNQRKYQRGPFRAGADRQIVVELYDLNTFLDDILLTGGGADRPAETDYARVTWLLSTAAMTSADYGAVVAGQVPNSGTVTMDAIDYRGEPPRTVLDDCAQLSGKNHFLYWDTGAVPKLWYDDAATSTGLQSTLKISDTLADVNNTSVFAPIYEGDILTLNPSLVKSTIAVRHKGGVQTATDLGTVGTYRQREHRSTHHRRMTASTGGVQANKWVNKLGSESQLGTVSILVPLANVNDVRAGSAVQVKLKVAGITSYTYFRVIQRDVLPAPGSNGDAPSDVLYKVRLTFMDDVRPTSLGVQPDSHKGTVIDEVRSNGTTDDASVIIDRGGITVTNGAITVTNPGGTVIIDGTSDMFRIAATGTVLVPKLTKVAANYASTQVHTGLTYDPMSDWSIKRPQSSGDWVQKLPYSEVGHSGLTLRYWHGRARVTRTDWTEVQAAMETTAPPLAGSQAGGKYLFRYYILELTAI